MLEKHFLDTEGKNLKEMLTEVIMDFIETIRVTVMLKTKEIPDWDDTVVSTSKSFDIDTSILDQIMQLRSEQLKLNKKETEELYHRFMLFVDQMVGIVDQME